VLFVIIYYRVHFQLLYIGHVRLDLAVAHVDLDQRVCAVRIEALQDLLARDRLEVDVQLRQTGERPEVFLARLIFGIGLVDEEVGFDVLGILLVQTGVDGILLR